MPSLEVAEQLKELTSTLASVESVLDVPRLEVEVTELEKQASAPDLWDDQERAQAVTSRLSFIQGEIRKALALRQRVDDLPIMFELAEVEGDDDMLGEAGA
ncbi:MAG TPA: peptide chain release factor 2, partial [Actinobacteria bacterium]|nr:peptide chain release factor 2 [Actinomycetota bacterium]